MSQISFPTVQGLRPLRLPRLASGLAAFASAFALSVSPALAGSDRPAGGAAPAGDFNGDGFQDWTIETAPPVQTGLGANIAVVFGSAGPGPVTLPADGGQSITLDLSTLPDRTFVSYDRRYPDRVGDFDGDGFDDLVLTGALSKSWVIYGAAGTSDVVVADIDPRITMLPNAESYARPVVVGAGDFNGDGFYDLVHNRPSPQPLDSSGRTNGSAVIVFGGARVATLETRGTGVRRLQINGQAKCVWRYVVFYTCGSVLTSPLPIGDYDGDGRDDLYLADRSFVALGRTSTATISGITPDALSVSVPVAPAGDPFTPRVDPPPPPPPGGIGTDGWTLSGSATRVGEGEVLLTRDDYDQSGAIFDARRTVDGNRLTVDFDLVLTGAGLPEAGKVPGNGATLALASESEGGVVRAKNYNIGLGWVGNKGIAFVFGTVKGGLTPSNNYVAIANSVVGKSGYPTLLQSAPAVSKLAGSTTHVTVRASGGVVTIALNGIERLRRTMTLPRDAWVGFTASTGGNSQAHAVRNVVVKST